MKNTIVIVTGAMLLLLILVSGCAQQAQMPTPTPSPVPTEYPTGYIPTNIPTVTAIPTPSAKLLPQSSDNRHAVYGTFFGYYSLTYNTQQGSWGPDNQFIDSASGEVYVMTRDGTMYKGYIQWDGSYRVDNIPTGNDIRFVKVVLYRDNGVQTINFQEKWDSYIDVACRTQYDIYM